MSIVIGAFYETQDGTVVRASGRRPGVIVYHCDDGQGRHETREENTAGWTRRTDLTDFPDARDPILPYAFDLLFDVDRRSRLVDLIAGATSEEMTTIQETMTEHRIVLTEEEEKQVERIREVDRLDRSAPTP